MDNSTQNIIKEIAQELDCGIDCYYNPKANELITIPNFGKCWTKIYFVNLLERN